MSGPEVGTLYVVATPIGNLQDISPRAIQTLTDVDLIAAEDTRHSGKLLHHFGITTPMLSYHQHNRATRESQILERLASQNVAIVSDAGTPAIADPGAELVSAARAAGFTIVPIPGPSAVIAAVSASGLVDAPFFYLGFLPRIVQKRRLLLGKAACAEATLVLFESPRRLGETLAELAELLGDRRVTVARELTKLHEEIIDGTLQSLAARYRADAPRGEIVIVVKPPEGELLERDSAEDVIRRLLADNLRPARAAREVSAILGISGAEAYALVRKIADDS